MNYALSMIGLDQIGVVGPDPFASGATRNHHSYLNTTLTFGPSIDRVTVEIYDNDTNLEDAEFQQESTHAFHVNGTSYGTGSRVETEYSYVMRPDGAVDSSQDITIYVLEIDHDIAAVACDRAISAGVRYTIIHGGSDDPVVRYDQLVVCFAADTKIATPKGLVAVQNLRAGDLVNTLDNGFRPIVWTGGGLTRASGSTAPIRIPAGLLSNESDLYVSPQHRILVRPRDVLAAPGQTEEVLVPAKALLNHPMVQQDLRDVVSYHHFMCEDHQLVWAEGAVAESFFPGKMALASLTPKVRQQFLNTFPELSGGNGFGGARRFIGQGRWQRMHPCDDRACAETNFAA